jgi:predicted lipoprotein with Yx(FWY)xxD motif
MRRTFLLGATAAGALTLAACGNGGLYGGGSAQSSSSSAASAPAGAASATALTASNSSLGTIVIDAKGRTVYAFDSDTAGSATSACTGGCAGLWPAVTTTSSSPTVTGLTGAIGTAPAPGGGQQITLDGHRLYTYAGDSGSGQVNGQGFMNIWWVVSPAGQEVKQAASSGSSSAAMSSSSPGYGY